MPGCGYALCNRQRTTMSSDPSYPSSSESKAGSQFEDGGYPGEKFPEPYRFQEEDTQGTEKSAASPSKVQQPPPDYHSIAIPPSGFRIPLTTESPFTPGPQCGPPPCWDLDGKRPPGAKRHS